MPEDLFKLLVNNADEDAVKQIREERRLWLQRKSQTIYREASEVNFKKKSSLFDLTGPAVRMGKKSDLSAAEHELLLKSLQTFIPWRKGPFEIFGHHLDAEWRSDKKMERILPHLDAVENSIIVDIGANNGYYMFRLAAYKPRAIFAFEPTVRHYYTFQMFRQFMPALPLQFELLGAEHMHLFHGVFDIVLCLGILYHHPDPIGILRGILESLKPGGQIIVESQGIPGKESTCLIPEKRYGKVPGTWFIPTESALVNWIKRAGFSEVTPFDSHLMSSQEQRSTEWMPYESYSDFLDPEDKSKTIEGYPAPHRFYLKARKKLR